MAHLGAAFEPLSEAAAVEAAEAWCGIAPGGPRTRIGSDFLIEAR
jgi:hypothetical protein